jgi:phosphopantothenoylcysteine synthetase/decarboxylase
MNTLMWESPFTGEHLARLEKLGATTVPPVGKRLACGDVGLGAMAAPDDIAAAALRALWRAYRSGDVAVGPDDVPLQLPPLPE